MLRPVHPISQANFLCEKERHQSQQVRCEELIEGCRTKLNVSIGSIESNGTLFSHSVNKSSHQFGGMFYLALRLVNTQHVLGHIQKAI